MSTFLELQDEVIAFRWTGASAATRARIKGWINTAYENVWNMSDWHFKRVSLANLAVTIGDSTPSMPADFEETRGVYDHNGDELAKWEPDLFERLFTADILQGTTGDPTDFMVNDRQITLAPVPVQARTFKHSYRRGFTHIHTDGNPAIGIMVEDADKPLWSVTHHGILVPEAILIGIGGEQDPDRKSVEATRDALLSSMLTDLGPDRGGGRVQYGMAYGY